MDAVSPAGGAVSQGAPFAPRPAPPDGPASFAAALERQIESTRSTIDSVRAEIDSLRSGGARRRALNARPTSGERASMSLADVAARLRASSTGDAADPFGWRQMARAAGEEAAPGYGAIFERQIQQESGFAPEVVFGLRKSSAGAEGIAQLMPQFYPNVDRSDPRASLLAGARSMGHYLGAWDGDVRKALASYNAGLGKVRQLVSAHGDRWESALPLETRQYLNAIVGVGQPVISMASGAAGVFGGRGPGGVLTMPVDRTGSRPTPDGLDLFAHAGSAVRAPADGTVHSTHDEEGVTLTIDHGNGWRSTMRGIDGPLPADGTIVRRGEPVGVVGGGARVAFGLTQSGRTVPPLRYLIG